MKKRHILMMITLLFAAIALVACNTNEQLTPMQALQNKYNEITSASGIVQTITIKKGALMQFESEKTYLKTQDGYTVTGSEKRWNNSSASEPFTTTPINEQVGTAVGAAPTLKLNASYFEEGFRLTETGLVATVKQQNVKDVFGVGDSDLKAPTSDLMLELSVSAERLASVRISYTSNGSNVVITLSMNY